MLVFVCSPYRGNKQRNVAYAISCCEYEMALGNTPFAPHLLYTRIVADDDTGINHGLEVLARCDELHVWGDKVSDGMKIEIEYADTAGIPIRYME